jgi:hypothetical protein
MLLSRRDTLGTLRARTPAAAGKRQQNNDATFGKGAVGMRKKMGIVFVTGLVMVGWMATFSEAGKPFTSAPPFTSVPPSGSAIATAGQAYALCATGVFAQLADCVRAAAGDASAIAACKADATAHAQACHDTFFSAVSAAAE